MRLMHKSMRASIALSFLASCLQPACAFYAETREPHNQAVENLMSKGAYCEQRDNIALAEKYYKLAEATCKALKGNNQDQMADIYALLENVYRKKHKLDQAIDYAKKVVEIDKSIYGEEHVFVAESLRTLGDLESQAKKYDEARKSYAQAIEVANKSTAKGYRWSIDATHANVLKKMNLIVACYDSYCRTFEAEDDTQSADDAYKSSIDKCGKTRDKEISAKDLQIAMFDRYRDYLARTKRDIAKDQVDQEFAEVARKDAANREYKPNALPK